MGLLIWRDIQRLPFKVAKNEYRFNCIFCPTTDTEFHLYVNRFKKVYHCFRCGAKGTLFDRSTAFGEGSRDFEEAIKSFKRKDRPTEIETEKVIRSLPLSKPVSMDKESAPFRDYLESRGVGIDKASRCRIRMSKDKSGVYANCLIFPIGSIDDPDYFVCRRIDGKEPKYINAPWPKKDTLYIPAIHDRTLRYTPYTVICEGVFDAIQISKVARVFALLGKEATEEQVERLVYSNEKIYIICLDPDAQSYAMKLALNLKSAGKKVGIVDLKDSDPADAPLGKLRRTFTDAYLQLSGRSSKRSRKRSMGDGTTWENIDLPG